MNTMQSHAGASPSTTGVTRRGFVGGAAGVAGGGVVAGMLAATARADEATDDIAPAKGHVVHQSYICTGCRTCELMCVLTHEQLINPQLARNIVHIDYQDAHRTNVMYCQQCDDPKCLKACPTGALHVDETTGARVIDQDVCIGCQSCLNACIFAAGGQGTSRIKYNEATGTCFKCDLCGGDPQCVKFCPLGASQLSWESYTIVRPGIDDYVEETTEGAIEGITFEKDYTGPHAGKAQDEVDWAMVASESGGVDVKGQVTSSDGAELRVRMSCDFYDANGNLLGTSEEHQYKLIMHAHLPLEFHFDIDDYTQIVSVTLVGNVSYWVTGVDEEY